ncbi:MAG: hypothetical protein CR997_09095 [Acidobacteria bacterium]|nr:MAG: hypothetical protein CR997_09095 [Acidobacteriota bacterium]
MNKQCTKCGHIMLVPDIPLPAGYTQKCIACGQVNNVSDQYKDPIADLSESSDRFLSQMDPSDIIDLSHANEKERTGIERDFSLSGQKPDQNALHALRAEFESRLTNLQAEIESLKQASHQSDKVKENGTLRQNPLLDSPIAENEAVFCSQQSGLANLCARKLRNEKIVTHIVTDLSQAIAHISEHAYQVIIVDHRMLHGKPEGVEFLKTLNNITLPVRRQQIVILLTPGIETGESQVFYQWGIDFNIHFDDLEALVDTVKSIIQKKKAIYSEYHGVEI